MTVPTHFRVAIAGTGFAGLGMAIRLKQQGIEDLVLLERDAEVGGVWRDNSYPGCACDVQSHLYSFSFAQNPNWSHAFSRQAEIQAYLLACVERFDLRRHIRFGHALEEASWDESKMRWDLRTRGGNFTAEVFISAVGGLSNPAVPELPGLERFQGKTMHSAQWDHAYRLEGRRVAVIGTGASAIQFIPEIQPRVAQLKVFQRTPPWVLPRRDHTVSEATKKLLRRVPGAQGLLRAWLYNFRELFVLGFRNPALMRAGHRLALRHLERSVADPALRAKLTPSYTLGCKRILISDDYWPALTRPNVEVVTHGIEEVLPHGLRTRDGEEHRVDALIFGTGFHVTDMAIGGQVRGRDGRTLAELWEGSPKAHLGTTVAGYPNFFMLQGPNTGLGHSSVLGILEVQFEHVLGALRHLEATGQTALEPRQAAQARFVRELDAQMEGTVWNAGGCASWYLDRTGRNSTLWPSSVTSFRRRVRDFDPSEYQARPLRATSPARGTRAVRHG